WNTPAAWVSKVLQKLMDRGWSDKVCMNVNFPDVEPDQVQGMEVVRQGRGSLLALEVDSRLDKRASPYFWFGFAMYRHSQVKDN
ncbi:5'/3'-nucleotidase SurE, partial [Acinetobacter baumannii]